jgi:hypothetical protein
MNGILQSQDSLIFVYRNKDVFSYPNYYDFPAGILTPTHSIENFFKKKIGNELKLPEETFQVKGSCPFACLLEGGLNLFYNIKASLSKEEFEKHFNNNFEKKYRPVLVETSKLDNFIKNNPVVFTKVLDYIYK